MLEEKLILHLKHTIVFLNKPRDDFPELKDYSEGQTFSKDNLYHSTEPFQTDDFSDEWSREEHQTKHKDFTISKAKL